MKNIILFMVAIPLVVIMSCSKKNDQNFEKEKDLVDVRFSAKLFDESIQPMTNRKLSTTKATALNFREENLFSMFTLYVFDENGEFVTYGSKVVINSDGVFQNDSLFFNLKLPHGTYKIASFGEPSPIDNKANISNYKLRNIESNLFTSELKTIKVDGVNTFEPLIMNRVSSKIEFNFIDKTPKEPLMLELKGNPVDFIYPFNSDLQSIQTNKSITFWTFPVESVIPIQTLKSLPDNSKEFTLINFEVFIYNESRVLIGTKKIPNVKIKKNHVTRLTGKLFDEISNESTDDGTSKFKAEIIKEYSPVILEQSF